MQKYNVTIRATIIKTIQVESEDEDTAAIEAHERFSVLCDDEDEDYDQETLEVTKA